MEYNDAERVLADAGYAAEDETDYTLLPMLDELHHETKDARPESFLPAERYAAWFALCQELRRLADYHERNLIRHLKYTEDYTWADVAEATQAKLNSRQAAQQRWSRLIKDHRGKPTGRAAKEPGAVSTAD